MYQQTAQANVDASSSAPTTAVQVMKAWVIFRDHRCFQKKRHVFETHALQREHVFVCFVVYFCPGFLGLIYTCILDILL